MTKSMLVELEHSRVRLAGKKVVALGLGYVAFATSNPAYLQLMFGGVLNDKDMPPELQAAGAEAYLTLRSIVADGIAAGELRTADVDEMALLCWSVVHGLSMLIINGPLAGIPPAEIDHVLNRLCDVIDAGL